MNKLILLALLLAVGCEPAAQTESSAAACAEISEPITATAGKQLRLYYTVPGFNSGNKECWAQLQATAKEAASAASGPLLISFLDSPDFTPGKDGAYDGNEALRKKVVAQVLANNEIGLYEFTPDPFGFGHYTEPK